MDKKADLPEEDYWETHDTSDYADWTEEPPIVVPHPPADIRMLPLPASLYAALEAEASARGISCQALAENWLREKLDPFP